MKRALLLLLVLLGLGAGAWLYENASIERLRGRFVPWMRRLEHWRDGVEAARRALARRDPRSDDPAGIAALRAWAWKDLARVASVSFRVEKPSHETAPRERTAGPVEFTVYGFRADGARVERSARAAVAVEWEPSPGGEPVRARVAVSGERPLAERLNATPRFHDGTSEAGLGAGRRNPDLKLKNWLIGDIWPGSGVAVLDFDRDGFEDLFVADGVRSILYRNDGRGRFTDVTEKAGLLGADGKGVAATGVAAGDVDGDGAPDLFVTDAFGPARMFRNRRDGTFEEITARSGISLTGQMRSAAFADVDGDGDLDLLVCVTGDYYRQMPDPPFDANDAKPNRLYLNDGHGKFSDATSPWGLGKAARWSLSSLFADYDGDGRPDLIVTNDFGLKNLYRNEGGKTFRDVTDSAKAQVRAYGMSAAWADFDGDGLLDLYTTGCDTQWYFLHDYPWLPIGLPGRLFLPIAVRWMETMATGNSLLLQTPEHRFVNATSRSGAAHAGWNWSAVAADLDGDSWPDIYATNGMWGDGRDHDRELEFWWETLAYWDDYVGGKKTFDRRGAGIAGIERDRFFRNRSGEGKPRDGASPLFEERSFLEGLDLETNGRAVVAFDADGDGALDVYVRSVEAPEAIFFGSRRPGEHYLRIRLAGTPAVDNRDGIGSRITAALPGGRRIVLETGNASGYLSTGSPIAHLGLGAAASIEDLEIRWPSGFVQKLGRITAVDRTITVNEAQGITNTPSASSAVPRPVS